MASPATAAAAVEVEKAEKAEKAEEVEAPTSDEVKKEEEVAEASEKHGAKEAEEPAPVREITQTDHLNKRLLVSFLERIKDKSGSGTWRAAAQGARQRLTLGCAGNGARVRAQT